MRRVRAEHFPFSRVTWSIGLLVLVLVLFSLSALELERATFRTCTDPYLASSLALLGSIGLGLFG